MTSKFIDAQTVSLRPQNEPEKILFSNINAMIQTGKGVELEFKNGDMLVEIKSKK